MMGRRGRIKKARYTDDQMVRILRETEEAPVTEMAKKHGVSEATIYASRKRSGEPNVTDVRHLNHHPQPLARGVQFGQAAWIVKRHYSLEVLTEAYRGQY
jgi:putative transposase